MNYAYKFLSLVILQTNVSHLTLHSERPTKYSCFAQKKKKWLTFSLIIVKYIVTIQIIKQKLLTKTYF